MISRHTLKGHALIILNSLGGKMTDLRHPGDVR
jgi:hypothetical protein